MKRFLTLCFLISSFASFAQMGGNSLRLKANGNYVGIADATNVSLNHKMTQDMWLKYCLTKPPNNPRIH